MPSKGNKIIILSDPDWDRVTVLNFTNMIMRKMVSLKLKDFASRHWAGKLDIQKYKTLLRVFFAADNCSKPMFLALSWRLLLSSCRILVCIFSHCSSRCSVSSNHLKPLACFGELVQGVRKALPEEHCKSWDSTIIFPHSVIASLICSGPVWYEKSFNKRNN